MHYKDVFQKPWDTCLVSTAKPQNLCYDEKNSYKVSDLFYKFWQSSRQTVTSKTLSRLPETSNKYHAQLLATTNPTKLCRCVSKEVSRKTKKTTPTVIGCTDPGDYIVSVDFVSFGQPSGT